MDNYHLTKVAEEWRLKEEKSDSVLLSKPTKEEAVKAAAEFLRDKTGSLKIHGLDGRVEEERTYPRSADPSNTPG